MTYLLDTDICSYWFLGRGNLRDKFRQVGYSRLALSRVCLAELMVVAHMRKGREGWGKAVEDLSRRLKGYDVDEAAWTAFPVIKARLLDSGMNLGKTGILDILHACVAHTRGFTVVTNNRKHFDAIQKIVGVPVEYWAEGN